MTAAATVVGATGTATADATTAHAGRGVARLGVALDPARRFGVEIECFVPSWWALVDALAAAGVPAYGTRYDEDDDWECECAPDECDCDNVETFGTATDGAWQLKDDCTLRHDTLASVELVSPILCGADGLRQLAAVGRALHAVGAAVNRSGGLHVHHDIRDLDVHAMRRLARNYDGALDVIEGVLAPSRHHDSPHAYNGHWRAQEAAWARATTPHDLACHSYRAILNFSCFPQYGTVEFRQHHGTTDARKIAQWVAFGQQLLASAVAERDVTATTVDQLADALGFAPTQRAFWHARTAALAGGEERAAA